MSAHFNQLSPAHAELLAMLAEECGEVVQAIGKVLRHGYESRHPDGGPSNREALSKECNDIMAVFYLMRNSGDTAIVNGNRGPNLAEAVERKLRYAHHQVNP